MVRTSTPNDGKKRGRVGGTWRRVSGREDLDQAMRSRFDPYSYESNWKTLRWLVAFLGVWIVLSIALAFNDNQTASYLEEQSDMGLTTTPPGDIYPATVVEYSKVEGIECDSVEEVVTFTEPCQRVVDIQREFNSRKDRGNLMFAGLIAVARHHRVPVLHGHSSRQPELANLEVVRTAVFAGLCRYLVFRPDSKYRQTGAVDHGAFQGQRPIRKRQRNRGLETNRQDSRYHVYLGAGLGRGVYFQPDTRTEGLLPPGDTIEGAISTLQTTVWSDAILGVAGLFAILMVTALHLRQEARHAKVGEFVYTPPPPELDLIQQAREERKSKPTPRLGGRVGKSRADIRTSGRERDE